MTSCNRLDVHLILAGYLVANAVFVLVRLGSIILSVLTFWYGLSLSDNQGLDIESGNFNTQIVRYVRQE
jgi:translocating chain-associated membrane protein 1